MGTKVSFDPVTRIIQVTQAPVDGVIEIDVQEDIYSDGKEDYKTDANFSKVSFPIRAVGGDPLPGSKVLGDTYFLDETWKIRPYAASHVLTVNGNFYAEDGSDIFIDPIGAYTVRIQQVVSNLVDSTVQQLSEIQHGVYQGGVTIDVIDGESGTVFPIGTPHRPCDNLTDSLTIAEENSLEKLYIKKNITLVSGDDVDNLEINGQNPVKTLITLESGVSTDGTAICKASVTGILDGDTWIKDCVVVDLTYVEGHLQNDILTGKIILAGTATTRIIDCTDGDADGIIPEIDMGGSGRNLVISKYSGDIKISNLTGSNYVSVDLNSGKVWIDSTVTDGYFFIRGVGTVVNLGTATVVTEGLINVDSIVDGVWEAVMADYETVNSFGHGIARMLGLQQENQYIDQHVYTSGRLTSARIRIYSSAGSVGTDSNVLATYTMTATYDGENLDSYKVVKA